MTTAEFADYDAVVLGDPTCGSVSAWSAAAANASVWGAAVDGNVFIFGSDEQYHVSQGGQTLMNGAAPFSVAESGKTGAYISLSCYYHGTAPGTPVQLLDDAFGSTGDFTVTDVPGCFNDAHIVASHPAFTTAGVTDITLSDWGCSVHEAFDNWPATFEVLAIALSGTVYNATDGTVGTPYVLARGVSVISDIDLTPEDAVNPLGTDHTVTAVVETDDPVPGTPVVGTTVTFTVVSGPNTGDSGTSLTDSSGSASFTYTGDGGLGTDIIQASFVDAFGRTQRSNSVTKTWEEPVDDTPPVVTCDETVNPYGETIPNASNTNEDGFFVIGGVDLLDGDVDVFVSDDEGNTFGPYPSGTNIKITESPNGIAKELGIGSSNGEAGAVSVHLLLNSDASVVATDSAGNSSSASCYVPPSPK